MTEQANEGKYSNWMEIESALAKMPGPREKILFLENALRMSENAQRKAQTHKRNLNTVLKCGLALAGAVITLDAMRWIGQNYLNFSQMRVMDDAVNFGKIIAAIAAVAYAWHKCNSRNNELEENARKAKRLQTQLLDEIASVLENEGTAVVVTKSGHRLY